MTDPINAPLIMNHESVDEEVQYQHDAGYITGSEMANYSAHSDEEVNAAIDEELSRDDALWGAYDDLRRRVINRLAQSTL